MSWRVCPLWLLSILLGLCAAGCSPTQPFYFGEDGDLSHYVGVATDIEYPDVNTPTLAEVENAAPPLSLSNPGNGNFWDLTLQEAVQTALANGKTLRSLGGSIQAPPSTLLNFGENTTTIYDPAITEAGSPGRNIGVEQALSAFDAQFNSSLFWEKNDRPVNSTNTAVAPILKQDLGTFQAELSKRAATGTQFFLRNNTSYDANNNPFNKFRSSWDTNIEAEFRHPLLQGSGVQFNRIAGPITNASQPMQGVVIARIETDRDIALFEGGVRNYVSDVELAYWELYFSYRNLDAVIAGRDSALQTWRKVYALFQHGARGGEAEAEAQAREQYFLFRAQVNNSLSTLYSTENRLRYMMGLSATDGRLIRPADEPTSARVEFDWAEVHAEALTRSPELRRQKWLIKQRELQLVASKNFLLPRLDLVARYRWRGFGDDLLDPSGGNPPFDNAVETLVGGDFQESQIGAQFSMPIGFRRELAVVRSNQLELAKQRAILQDQELELSHQLSDAIRDLDRFYQLTIDNFNRRVAAARQVEAVRAAYETNTVTLDLLLDAQRRLADAESSYYRSLVDYNQAIRTVHLRKGSLLEYNNVYLAEGPWPCKAYFDAEKRARERDAGMYIDYGMTRPGVFSRGPIAQDAGTAEGVPTSPAAARAEQVPTPAAEPKDGTMGTPGNDAEPPMPDAPALPMAPQTSNSPSNPRRLPISAARPRPIQAMNYTEPVESEVSFRAPAIQNKPSGAASDQSLLNTSDESNAASATAAARSTATGWKGVQR